MTLTDTYKYNIARPIVNFILIISETLVLLCAYKKDVCSKLYTDEAKTIYGKEETRATFSTEFVILMTIAFREILRQK